MSSSPEFAVRPQFVTTDWGLVRRAGASPLAENGEALAKLYGDYWYPVYGWFRGHSYDPDDSEDLAQEFFVLLACSDVLAGADPMKGRFRDYVRGVLRNFHLKVRERQGALKRGGSAIRVPFDRSSSEHRFASESTVVESPDRAFDRRWAETVLLRATEALAKEVRDEKEAAIFAEIKQFLAEDVPSGELHRIGARLKVRPNTISARIRRLRDRFGQLVFAEVVRTVGDPSRAREEMRNLLESLADGQASPFSNAISTEPNRELGG